MSQPHMQFKDFVDLLLVGLYDRDRKNAGAFFDLGAIAREIKDDIPRSWTFDAAKVLEVRSLAQCMYTFGGVHASLTGEGRLYVEEGRGITKDAREHRGAYYNVTVTGDNNVVSAGEGQVQTLTIEQEREPAFDLIERAKSSLMKDESISGEKRIEASTYLELLKSQLKKQDPDRSLIAALLEALGKVTSIAGNVASLIRLFNAWQ
jgi:hypothetical protein